MITGSARGLGVASIGTELMQIAPNEIKRQVGAAGLVGRMATAADLADKAVFLASRDADYIIAQTDNVDGGNWMG